jgi:hypothetical protein
MELDGLVIQGLVLGTSKIWKQHQVSHVAMGLKPVDILPTKPFR